MGTILNEVDFQRHLNNTFVFDLEYIGVPNDLDNCYIWEIGAVHLMSGDEFTVTVDPGFRPLPPPMSSEFVHVTDLLLREREAVTYYEGWKRFYDWIHRYTSTTTILIAHNNFKSDKIMLEVESKRRKLPLPYNWWFFDSLLYSRKAIPKQLSYTLHDLYIGLTGKRIENNHSALPDAKALREILNITNVYKINGPIYPSYCTSLQVVKWLGPSSEIAFFDCGIYSLEQLIAQLVSGYTRTLLVGPVNLKSFVFNYITETCGIISGNSYSISDSIIEKWLPV